MHNLPPCPQCHSSYTYEDRNLLVCPECGHEWIAGEPTHDTDVRVVKDLKVKGSSLVVKVGTKVKNIRLVEGDHDIDCKIDGIGAMKLKSEFVRKA